MHLLIRHRVGDFEAWKRVFDSHAAAQRASGLNIHHVWRSVDDPSEVVLLFEVTDADKARAFLSSPDVPEAQRQATVIGKPEATFLDSAAGSGDARRIDEPRVIQAAGNKPKLIEEFIGRVSTATTQVSVARMRSPSGWSEPGQTPEFDEYTVVLSGMLRVATDNGHVDVHAGQGVIAPRGRWVQYSTPSAVGAEYIAVCLPAFSPDTVHRDS